ncbi:MAG: phage baseplate assembly protein V [Ruminococcus sp.]|nr:phage baseplate assembly protein V [Ruminococcus sp.]
MNISGFEKACRISHFELESTVNGHTYACFDAVLQPENVSDVTAMVNDRRKTVIKLSDNTVVMTGCLYSAEGDITDTCAYLHIRAVSGSIWLEESFPEKRRVFQDTKKNAKKIIEHLNSANKHSKCSVEVSSGLSQMQKEITDVIVQDKTVNDHEFAVHICALHDCALISKYDDDIVRAVRLGEERISLSLDSEKRNCISELKAVFEKGQTTVQFASLSKISPGASVRFEDVPACYAGKSFVVMKVRAVLQGEYLKYEYTAVENADLSGYILPQPECFVEKATVSERSDDKKMGRLQVGFDSCEDIGESSRYWASYLTPYVGSSNNGVFMIPDVGDRVCVMISHGDCVCIGSERRSAIQDDYSDLNALYAVYGKDRYMKISDEGIIVSCGEKSSVKVMAEQIVSEQDKRSITLDKDSITVKNEDSTALTLKKDSIVLKQGDRKETLDKKAIFLENSGTSLTLESGSSLLKAKKIDFKTSM